MLFTFVLKLALCSTTQFTSSYENPEDNFIIKKCADLFKDEIFLKDWSRCKSQVGNISICKNLKAIALKISNVILSVINEFNSVNLKKISDETIMDFLDKIIPSYCCSDCYTPIIFGSFKRLIDINNTSLECKKKIDNLILDKYEKSYANINKLEIFNFLSTEYNYGDYCKKIACFEFGLIYELIKK